MAGPAAPPAARRHRQRSRVGDHPHQTQAQAVVDAAAPQGRAMLAREVSRQVSACKQDGLIQALHGNVQSLKQCTAAPASAASQ
ncbi:MAG: hypothetical protein IPQ21_18690 [Betaproteobacteria bacterium]|nr:hypothetical protein [Betaproteobacteria bacterium]